MRDTDDHGIFRNVLAGMGALTVLVIGVSGWAMTTELAGAVISGGTLVVDTNVKRVQHLSGGIVSKIAVRNGDEVAAGDLLIRLDDTVTRANLAIVSKSLIELVARQSRLKAERDDQEFIAFPASLVDDATRSGTLAAVTDEQKLFKIRKAARVGQKEQLTSRIAQFQQELIGLGSQIEAKKGEIVLIHRQLEGVRHLWEKKLVSIDKLTALEREAVRLTGESAQLTAAVAQTKGKIAEIELQVSQIDRDLKSEVAKELRDIQGRVEELLERRIAADDQLRRIDITAPQAGIVHQLSVHTVGGVVQAGEQLMLVVPKRDDLVAEVKINPQDVDQVRQGQTARLRFVAFNQRTTPEIDGKLAVVSADISADPKTGGIYYTARIEIDSNEAKKLNGLKLVPGMPVEAFVETDKRSVMSFLLKPLEDQITRAFREQ